MYIILTRMLLHDKEKVIEGLVNRVADLSKECPINNGKGMDQVKEQQRRRKLAELKEGCKMALWYGDTFNVDLLSIVFQAKSSKKEITLKYEKGVCTSSTLTPNDLMSILYLLDQFGISDEFYHEIAMIFPSLPWSHFVKDIQRRLNASIVIKWLLFPYYGAYRPCIQEAIKAQVIIMVVI